MKKENKEKSIPKPKQLFDVRIECLLPSIVSYRVLADNAEQALQLCKNATPNSIKPRLAGRRNLKATVLEAGTTMVRLIKNLVGGASNDCFQTKFGKEKN